MACVQGANGPSASFDDMMQSAIKAGFGQSSGQNGLITIVSIAQAESSGKVYCVNEIGATGLLQFYPGSKVTQCNLNDPDPQKALDCNFQEAYRESAGGKNFCPWASYANNTTCPPASGRINTQAQFNNQANSALTRASYGSISSTIHNVTTGQQNPIGTDVRNSPVGQGVITAQNAVAQGFQNLGSGLAALTGPFQAIAKFFSEPKVAFARILLFILGIFIAFEAVKHLGGSNSNLAVVGAQNAGKATFGKKVAETAEVA